MRSQTQVSLGSPPLGGPQRLHDRQKLESGSVSASAMCGCGSRVSWGMGLSSAYLSQVSVREAVQILLEPTDMNRVLVPVGIEARMVRPAQRTDAWAAPKGTTIIIRTRRGSCCCYALSQRPCLLYPWGVSST